MISVVEERRRMNAIEALRSDWGLSPASTPKLVRYLDYEALQNLTLTGTARFSRPCPICQEWVKRGSCIINLGKVKGRWLWIHFQCAPDAPAGLPSLRELLFEEIPRLDQEFRHCIEVGEPV